MIYNFNEKQVPKLSQVGGKAKALIETSIADMPVPSGLVLSVEFFTNWLNFVKSSEEFKAALNSTTKENCDKVKAIASSLLFDEMQRNLFAAEVEKLDGTVFAVRSSSPEEDLVGTSFAGMYETYLGTKKTDLEKYIALTFSSCFDTRVMEYKKQNNIALENTAIAIIVQKQIASDTSGVGFSLNPLNNAYDEVFINASFGLGEAIVSGIVTPDSYIYDAARKSIIQKKISSKEISLWLNDDGGIYQKENEDKEKQALSDEQIVELSNLIKKCEKYYGKPMDIEWAFENGKLYLLQSRPITTYFPLFEELQTKPNDYKRFYIDITMMTQGFDEPMSVLGLELWSNMLYDIKFGMFTSHPDGTAPAIYGKHYFSVTAISKALNPTMMTKVIKSYDGNIRKIFDGIDVKANPYKGVPYGIKGAKLKMASGAFSMMPGIFKSIFSDHKKVVDAYLHQCNDLIADAKAMTKDEDFSKNAKKSLAGMCTLMSTASVMIAGMFAQMRLAKLFKGSEVEEDVVTMGMDLDGNPTSEMGHLLFKMASSDEFKTLLTREEFVIRAENRNFSSNFLKLYDEFMEKFAVRGFFEIDVASKRIYEDVGMLYDKLEKINTQENQILMLGKKREQAYNRLLAYAKQNGFEKKFIKNANKYKETFGYREHPKYIIVYITALLHEVALELAKDFVAEGRLDKPYDIFDLHSEEISKAQQDNNFDLRMAREKNLSGYKLIENVKEFPLVIDSRGKIYKPKLEIVDGDLIGDPIASGKAVGRAKVLRTPYEKPLLPGEILIAKATEPSWTPIFTNAVGVIMEIGGPLQHGGIIAREYGIPCVSGLIGIMDIIKDGDMVEVDGTNGVVRIIQENK